MTNSRSFAIVTGASSGIGYELAKQCAENGFDLLIAADQPEIEQAAQDFRTYGVNVDAMQTDLATLEGVDELYAAANGRPVDALLANAGHGLGHSFLDQEFTDIRHVIETNVTGTTYLVHKVGRDMRGRNQGRILLTGSSAGHIPGPFQAVYHSSKAYVDSFAVALRNELKDTEITVTCLQPGATETEFFERADLMDTKLGQQEKADPAKVAKVGFEAMMKGEGDVVPGLQNKMQVAASGVLPQDRLAQQNRKMTEPGSAEE
ncbi:MAG: SDR family NAD(P)-dependent oxidoreductase [Caldilineaceae bacterium]|nr:SDR family NAD(P)-dependent oxidoreductase [Caldilineaceae bacterium]